MERIEISRLKLQRQAVILKWMILQAHWLLYLYPPQKSEPRSLILHFELNMC